MFSFDGARPNVRHGREQVPVDAGEALGARAAILRPMLWLLLSAFAEPPAWAPADTPELLRARAMAARAREVREHLEEVGSLARMETECAAGDTVSCGGVALWRSLGTGPAAVPPLVAHCAAHGTFCAEASNAVWYLGAPDADRRALWAAGCTAGDDDACVRLAASLGTGAELLAALDRACALQPRVHCFDAALARVVLGAPQDAHRGLVDLARMARGGHAEALRALVHVRWGGPSGIPPEWRDTVDVCLRERVGCAPLVDALESP